jgi:hypothetical protein
MNDATHRPTSGAGLRATPAKAAVRTLLEEGRLDAIAERASASRRVLGTLLSLTYDADPTLAWRAVEATGVAAARIADDDPAPVREHLRRLLWLISEESGGICWRAPEAMAEIVARRPEAFADYVPIVAHLLVETAEEDLAHFRAGMLWALGRLGRLAADGAGDVLPLVVAALDHADARVRGAAVWCLGRLGHVEPLAARPLLTGDGGVLELPRDGALRPVTVAELVAEALAGDGGQGSAG